MNVLRRIAMGIGGTVVVALVVALAAPKTVHAVVSALVTVANTATNPVPAQEVKESRANYITVSFSPDSGSIYYEVAQDGTISSTPFTIPSGEQFVITDVNWMTLCERSVNTPPCGKNVGDMAIFALGITNNIFASYTSMAPYFVGGGTLFAGRNDSLRSGLVVTQLPTPSVLFPFNSEQVFQVNLRGYLVP